MEKISFILSFLLLASVSFSQDLTEAENTEISVLWVLLHGEDGQSLAHQKIILDGDTAITDEDGFLESTHPAQTGHIQVQIVHDSLELVQNTFHLDPQQSFVQFTLEVQKKRSAVAETESKADMVVIARREPLHDRKEVSKIEVSRAEMREVVGVQNDPIQVLRTFPGVTSTNDANNRPYVRGGDWHETRIFWNRVPVLQPFHVGGSYSLFNMESIDNMVFYSGGFPVEGSNSLSGAIFLTSRPPPLDTASAWVSMSMLKGHAWVGAPIIKEKLGISVAYQSFWYDFLIKRFMDLTTLFTSSKKYKNTVKEFKEYVDLPNFKDFEASINYQITPSLRVDYTYLRALDIYRVVVPQEYSEIIDGGGSAPSQPSNSENILTTLIRMDTVALVEIPNNIHGLNAHWNINSKWDIKGTLAYQDQFWKLQFGNMDLGERPIYDFDRYNWHGNINSLYRLNSRHFLSLGIMGEYDHIDYSVKIPRLAYEALLQSNLDMMENITFVAPEGIVITEDGAVRSLETLFSNIYMDYVGSVDRTQWGMYASDNWTLDENNRVTLGARLDFENAANSLSFSPRISWLHRLSPRQELSLSTGIYAQDNFEFYYRHLNPKLKPEKAGHFNAEWSLDITPDYRIEISSYAKKYWDLAAGHLVSTGKIDEYDARDGLHNMYDIDRDVLWNMPESEYHKTVSPAQWDSVLLMYGEKTLAYDNAAVGWALGTEFKLNYDPTPIWRGWASAEISMSKRQDDRDGVWYNFRRHRPWAIKLHNYFDMPSDWEFSVRLEHSAGLVYTGYTDFNFNSFGFEVDNSDTLFVIEKKNNRRYAYYNRLDFGLKRNFKFFGLPAVSFMEVWNAFNTPNFILRDSETGALKNADLSYPIPVFFSGFELRW